MRRLVPLVLAAALLFGACGGGDDQADGGEATAATQPTATDNAGTKNTDPAATQQPTEPDSTAAESKAVSIAADASWQWQLQGEINTSYDVDVYDIDLFDASQSVIDELRADGRVVICYFSAGSYEDWRDDATAFPVPAIGETLDGWEDERWVDTRDAEVRSALADRLDRAVQRDCDGVEPDNVTAFQNDSGFELTAGDQLDFNRFLATEAHGRGLLIGLKNDLAQIPDLIDDFDFAVNEECLQYDECGAYQRFVDAGKAVFNAEYDDAAVDEPDGTCAAAAAAGLTTLILPLDLDDSFRVAC